MRKSLVVAMAEDRVIGANNQLPWHVPADLRKFRELTRGKPVIMGRKTFESIGRPLKDRTNIVVTRAPDFRGSGVTIARSLDEALEIARTEGPIIDRAFEEIMVIGGEQIFKLALEDADRIYLTEIKAKVSGDAFFPEFDLRDWRETERVSLCEHTSFSPAADFTVLERRAA